MVTMEVHEAWPTGSCPWERPQSKTLSNDTLLEKTIFDGDHIFFLVYLKLTAIAQILSRQLLQILSGSSLPVLVESRRFTWFVLVGFNVTFKRLCKYGGGCQYWEPGESHRRRFL